jgi:gas vesicle protein
MKDRRSFNFGLLLGAAAGAAAGWLIYSQKGQEIRTTASEKMQEAGHQLKEKVSSEIDHLTTKAQQIFANGKEAVEEKMEKAERKAKNMAKATTS